MAKKATEKTSLRVLVPLAEGFEETEAVTVIDLLRRAGMRVTVAGLTAGAVTGSRGIAVVPDAVVHAIRERVFDLVVVPGGRVGADHLAGDEHLSALLQRAYTHGALIGAICAGTRVLARAGLIEGRRVTSFPGALNDIRPQNWTYCEEPVVVDGRLVTSRGPGTAIDFALMLIEKAAGRRKRRTVESRLMRP